MLPASSVTSGLCSLFPTFVTTSPCNQSLFSCLFFAALQFHLTKLVPSQFAVPLSGSELGAMEGPPDVPRLHRDEDPTRGSLVQQEEAIAVAQGEEQKHKPPEEIEEPVLLKPQQPCSAVVTCHHTRLGCTASLLIGVAASTCFVSMTTQEIITGPRASVSQHIVHFCCTLHCSACNLLSVCLK